MALKEGTYRIRFVPISIKPPFVGGLYATATGIGEPILAEPGDSNNNLQVWEVHRNAETGRYTITQPGFQVRPPFVAPGPVLMGWSLADPDEKFPGGNILFRSNCSEFDIQPVGEGENLMYSIGVPKGIPSPSMGRNFYVTEVDHILYSLAYWSNRHHYNAHPHWQFIPVERK